MNRVYLMLGSNMGDRAALLESAVGMLVERLMPDYLEVEDLCDAVNTSDVVETEPWGFDSDDKFLNQAFMILTDKDAAQVLETCHEIEDELGRNRNVPSVDDSGERVYLSRPIDIDIIFFDCDGKPQVFDTPDLKVPHPLMHQRMFVLEPLSQIAKDYVHPGMKKSVGTLKKELKRALKSQEKPEKYIGNDEKQI